MFTLYLFSEYLHWLSEIVHAWLKSGGVCVPTCNKLQHLSLRKIIKIIKNQLFPLSAHLHRVHFINRRSCCLAPPTEDRLAELISASRQAPLLMFVEFKLRLCGTHTHTHRHQNHSPDCGSSGPASTLCLLKNPQQPYILQEASSQFLAIS